jgi:hypothetical protein
VIRDSETVVLDSWSIAAQLEDSYPDRPSLFGGEQGRARSLLQCLGRWRDARRHCQADRARHAGHGGAGGQGLDDPIVLWHERVLAGSMGWVAMR